MATKKAAIPTTKSAILADLAETGAISKKQMAAVYDRFLEIAYTGAKDPKGFTIPGLGKLIKQRRPARKCRNPATGETIKVPAKTVVKFRLSKAVQDSVLPKKK